jgi:hypothetical protein
MTNISSYSVQKSSAICNSPGLLTILIGSVSRFDPGQGTYISCEYKEGLSDETKNRGPICTEVSMPGQVKDPTQVDSSL